MSDLLSDISAKLERDRSEHIDALASILLRTNPGVWFEVGPVQFTRESCDNEKLTMRATWSIRWFRDGVEIDPKDLAWLL